MNARADNINGQSDSVSNQSSGGKLTFYARSEKDYEQEQQVRWNLVMWLISFLTGHQTLNQVSVVVHAENSTFFLDRWWMSLQDWKQYRRQIEQWCHHDSFISSDQLV